MSYSLSDQQASNFNPEMYANQIFNSTSQPIRRPMYLPGPMAKGNFIGGLQMLGDAFGGLKDTLSNRKLKKRLFEESLPEYYKYTVEQDPNDPNDYVLDTKDLYDAMMGEGTLRTPDTYERDLKKYSMVDFDPESGQYNTMYSSRPIDQSLYPGYSDIFGEGSKSLGQIREDIMGNQELMDLITQAQGAPEGFFPYMQPDGRMGVTEDPDYLQYYYNTMMGNYEMGGSLPEAQFLGALKDGWNSFTSGVSDAYDDVSEAVSETVEDVKNTAWTYGNPYNYTRGAGYDNPVSAIGGYLMGDENAISGPADYSGSAGNKDDAFAQARKDLGPGQYFTYDGVRYTTDYYGQTEDKNTNEVLDMLKEGIGENYDQGAYDRFIDLWNQVGQPDFNLGADYDPGFLAGFAPSFQEITDVASSVAGQNSRIAPHVNPMTSPSSGGNIYITDGSQGSPDYTQSPSSLMNILIEEMAHSQQLRDMGRFNFVKDYLGDLFHAHGDQGSTYDTEGTIEHDAHKVMALPFYEYVYEGRKLGGSLDGQLPKAQIGMSLFDPNALDAGIGVTGGGAGIRSNSNSSNITAESLATDVTEEGNIFGKAAENLVDFFKTLEIPRFFSAYEYGGSLPRAQVMGEFGEMYLDPNKPLSQQTDGPTKEEIETANLATAGAKQYAREEEEKDYQSIVASDPDKYNIKVIQYPYGYEGMEPGHIEAALVDNKGNYISAGDEAYADILRGRDPFINRWDNVGNRRVTYRGDDPDVRTATMELSREEVENFLDQASTFLPTDNKLFGLPTAFGFQTTDGAYDFITSNCADGVCLGLGDPDGPDMYDAERRQNLTNPLNVMDLVAQDPRTVSSSGNRVTLQEGVSDLMNREMGGLVEYQNFGQVNRPTFQEWFIENQVRASAMNQQEAEKAYDEDTMDPQEFAEKYAGIEIDEVPMPRLEDDVTIANPTVTGKKAKFQRFLDSPGMDLFGGIGTFGVQSATALNEMFGLDRVAREAEEDRMRMTSADNAFMASNPLFDQGVYDVNTGLTPGGYAKGFGMARLGMEVDADPEIIEALVKAGANINYI